MNNVHFQDFQVDRKNYENRNGHSSFNIWLTGLSGSGKSTIANGLNKLFFEKGMYSVILDGDNTRLGINKDLSFSYNDRAENIRRVAEMSKLFINSGQIVISSFISPFKKDRETAREIISSVDFIEVYIDCPIEECEKRDVKGLYAKARNGEINEFTGISSPYEAPENADIVINTKIMTINDSIDFIFKQINEMKCLNID